MQNKKRVAAREEAEVGSWDEIEHVAENAPPGRKGGYAVPMKLRRREPVARKPAGLVALTGKHPSGAMKRKGVR